jgi:hypothetical protein
MFNTVEPSDILFHFKQLLLSNRRSVYLESNLTCQSNLGQRLSVNRSVFHHTKAKDAGC